MEEVKIQYVDENLEGTCIKTKVFNYESEQLNRIEKKLDNILCFINKDKLSSK